MLDPCPQLCSRMRLVASTCHQQTQTFGRVPCRAIGYPSATVRPPLGVPQGCKVVALLFMIHHRQERPEARQAVPPVAPSSG